MNEKQISELEDWLETSFNKLFDKRIKQGGYIKTWIAIVNSYDGTAVTASVHLLNDEINIIPNIKNKSGVSLIAGDVVELHSRLGTLGSCYIAVKY